MQVTSISVTAGRNFPHPTEEFSTLKNSFTLTAQLHDHDDAKGCIQQLHAMADSLAEEHKQRTLRSLRMREHNAKAQGATENKADALLAKHSGGK